MRVLGFVIASLIAFPSSPANAAAVYWNLFNLEGESSFSAVFATYGTVDDMLTDTNRLASDSPVGTDLVASRNIVGSGSDGSTYWNLFNLEGESSFSSVFATYGTVDDMLTDTNRLASFSPIGTDLVASRNIVGSGSDGSTYWNLFNLEGESSFSSVFATYGTVDDMLNDTNRLASYSPIGTDLVASRNIVGSGSDGSTYWNLFNLEGESSFSAAFATYGTVDDMLNDTNRLASYSPIGTDLVASRNIVGTGAFFIPDPIAPVPLPASGMLLLVASAVSVGWWRRSRRKTQVFT